MNQLLEFAKKHGIPIVIFIVLAFAYCLPVLQGSKLKQLDIVQSMCMQGELRRYLSEGEHILWTNAMFSGMPTFQIMSTSKTNFVGRTLDWFAIAFHDPTYLLIMSMLGVYLLCVVLGINRWLAVLAAMAVAFSTFNILSIEAGHSSKVRSMALMAPLLAGVIVTYRGQLLAGGLLTAFITILAVKSNHVQITYYTIIIAGLLVAYELYRHLAERKIAEFLKATALMLAAGILGLACNTSLLWPTYDYSHSTIRGGQSELDEKKEATASGGLDKKYAFRWSYGIAESFTFIVPHFAGGGTGEIFKNLDEESATYKALKKYGYKSQGKEIAQQIPAYWGNQPFTGGPTYFGAVVVFLFLFGALAARSKLKWWFIACITLALLLSWGRNFALLSDLFFHYVPIYNKFRTPSMFLSVVQLLAPVLAVIGLNELLAKKVDRIAMMRNLKISGGIVGGVCALLLVGGSLFSFSTNSYPDDRENDTDKEYYDSYLKMTKNEKFATDMLSALKEDRKSLMQRDALRSLILVALAVGMLYFFIQEKLKFPYFAATVSGLVLFDLCGVDWRYLNTDNFISKSDFEREFAMRPVDRQLLQDKELYFRVHDITRDPFNNARPSYYLKTVGGYHAAKMQHYQEMIEHHIGRGNMGVLNMLNTKYVIINDEKNQPVAQINRGALGNAWMVSSVQLVNSADEEIDALENLKPDSVVVIDKRFESKLPKTTFSREGEVKLTSYHPDKLKYSFSSSSDQFVVFSEIFYKGNQDWVSYLDSKEAEHVRVNYILRGMVVPAGNHEIVFEFRPKSYYTGEKITFAANVAFLLCAAGYGFVLYRKKGVKASARRGGTSADNFS